MRVLRFASNDAHREWERKKEKEREKEPVFSRPLFVSPLASSSFRRVSRKRCQKQFQESRCRSFNPPLHRTRCCSSPIFPFSQCAPNKSAKPLRMPRVVTILRYVTTLSFMAYLTGMRVTGRKRAHLTLAPRTDGRVAPSRNPNTWWWYLTWAVSSSRKGTLESTSSMGREERDGIDREAGWSISRFMGGSRSATCKGNDTMIRCADSRDNRKRMQSDFSRQSRVHVERKNALMKDKRLEVYRASKYKFTT